MARPKEFDPDTAINAAMELFWANGYAATTPAELVSHLGIGRGSLYNTFQSKNALYRRALGAYRDEMNGRLTEILQSDAGPLSRLETAVEAVVEHASGCDQRGCLVTNAIVETAHQDDVVAELVRGVLEQQVDSFAFVIRQAQAAGEIAADQSPTALARYLVTFLNGIRIMERAGTAPQDLRPLARVALQALHPATP